MSTCGKGIEAERWLQMLMLLLSVISREECGASHIMVALRVVECIPMAPYLVRGRARVRRRSAFSVESQALGIFQQQVGSDFRAMESIESTSCGRRRAVRDSHSRVGGRRYHLGSRAAPLGFLRAHTFRAGNQTPAKASPSRHKRHCGHLCHPTLRQAPMQRSSHGTIRQGRQHAVA